MSQIVVSQNWSDEDIAFYTTRECMNELDGIHPSFRRVLAKDSIKQQILEALTNYCRTVTSGEPPHLIRAVRVSLRNYFERLGIGLISCCVEPKVTIGDDDVLIANDEIQSPSIGVISEEFKKYVFPAFPIENVGGEEINGLSKDLRLQGFMHGETLERNDRVGEKIFHSGDRVIVPNGCKVGMRVGLVDEKKLEGSGFSYSTNVNQTVDYDGGGQAYFCRVLTAAAVRRALRTC